MTYLYPTDKPFLSIIIPAHNEATRLPQSLALLRQFINRQPYRCEVIVVENGSSDDTAGMVKVLQEGWPELKLLQLQERGKGLAVKTGMLAASGYYRFMMDADLSMLPEEISKFIPPRLDVPVAIASREAPGARRFDEPAIRHFAGRVFNTLVRALVLPGVQDSQSGFKCFSAEAAERIFPLQTFSGWIFDVEVLAIARELGFDLREVAICWTYGPGTRLSIIRDAIHMARDVWKIRRNVGNGLYREKPV